MIENKDIILAKAGWLTNIKTTYIPPKTEEEIERLRLENNEYIYKMIKTRCSDEAVPRPVYLGRLCLPTKMQMQAQPA
jgi:hypothetical protein